MRIASSVLQAEWFYAVQKKEDFSELLCVEISVLLHDCVLI